MKRFLITTVLCLVSLRAGATIETCDEGLNEISETSFALGEVLKIASTGPAPYLEERVTNLSNIIVDLNQPVTDICLKDLDGNNSEACSLAIAAYGLAYQKLGGVKNSEEPSPADVQAASDSQELMIAACSQQVKP